MLESICCWSLPASRQVSVVFANVGVLAFCMVGIIPLVFAEAPAVNWNSLHLTSQQSQHINQVEAEWKTTASEVLPQIQKDKAELVELLNSPKADQGRIMALQNRINANKSRLHTAAIQSFLKKKEYLTSEQQQQLQQILGNGRH